MQVNQNTGWMNIRWMNIHDAKVVKDLFSQCEKCKMWTRLLPKAHDDYGRTIDLQLDHKQRKWICETCWDKEEEQIYGK